MTLNCSEKRKLDINKNYKMTFINESGGLKNGRCYSMLGNVNIYTQGLAGHTGMNMRREVADKASVRAPHRPSRVNSCC